MTWLSTSFTSIKLRQCELIVSLYGKLAQYFKSQRQSSELIQVTGVSISTDSPAVYGDWSVLSELLLRLVHLADEVDESFAGLGHSLFRPVSELELANGPRLTVLQPAAMSIVNHQQNLRCMQELMSKWWRNKNGATISLQIF